MRVEAPFSTEDISRFLVRVATALESARQRAGEMRHPLLGDDLRAAGATLAELSAAVKSPPPADLESFERNLTALEEKVHASLLRATTVESMAQLRAEVERSLAPYRRRMSVVEVEALERRFLKNRLLEQWKIPRLSLFYL